MVYNDDDGNVDMRWVETKIARGVRSIVVDCVYSSQLVNNLSRHTTASHTIQAGEGRKGPPAPAHMGEWRFQIVIVNLIVDPKCLVVGVLIKQEMIYHPVPINIWKDRPRQREKSRDFSP